MACLQEYVDRQCTQHALHSWLRVHAHTDLFCILSAGMWMQRKDR